MSSPFEYLFTPKQKQRFKVWAQIIFRFWQRYTGKILNDKFKRNFMQAIPFWTASVVAGLAAVIYSKFFFWAESLNLYLFELKPWLIFIMAPFGFIVSWLIVRAMAPYAKGSGIPQVMAAIDMATPRSRHKIRHLLSIKVILAKVLSSLVMVFGGGAIGREGPTIQISAAIFKVMHNLLPRWWPQVSSRNMIMTGAAAGLAAAFNTPLGGIVFVVEELTRTHISYFRTAIFTAVIIAGLTAQAIAGPYLYLGFPKIGDYSWSIIWGVLFVAGIAGFLGAGTSKLILNIFKWKASFKHVKHHILFLLVCSSILASIAFFWSAEAMGSGKEIMDRTLFTTEKHLGWDISALRIGSPILAFTSGGAGGIFAPGLSAGASIGATISGWFSLTGPNTNLLILVGMVSFLTGITRSPFTSAILVLEMTDRHSLIFHLMLAGTVANAFALLIDRHSFYDHLKHRYLEELGEEKAVIEEEHDEEGIQLEEDH